MPEIRAYSGAFLLIAGVVFLLGLVIGQVNTSYSIPSQNQTQFNFSDTSQNTERIVNQSAGVVQSADFTNPIGLASFFLIGAIQVLQLQFQMFSIFINFMGSLFTSSMLGSAGLGIMLGIIVAYVTKDFIFEIISAVLKYKV
jgi:hypothetical protein